MKRIIAVIAFLFVASALAQTATVPPPPVLTPFDPTPIAAMLGQQSAWTGWAQKAILDVGSKVDGLTDQTAQVVALKAQLATDEATITTQQAALAALTTRVIALETKLGTVQTKITAAGSTLATP